MYNSEVFGGIQGERDFKRDAEMQSAVVDALREFGGVMKESSGKQVIVDPKYDRSQIPVMTYKEIYEKLGPVIITDENPEASLEEYLLG